MQCVKIYLKIDIWKWLFQLLILKEYLKNSISWMVQPCTILNKLMHLIFQTDNWLFNIFADWKYCVIQCTGYLKSWAPAKIDLEEHEGDGDGEACNLSCLVAVGRLQSTIPTSLPKKPRLRSIKFVSRHAMDGKFLFVDQRLIF